MNRHVFTLLLLSPLLTACPGGGNAHPPSAVADADAEHVLPNTTVVLDGSGSTDPDDDIDTYYWEQASGPAVDLDGEDTDTATFVAPVVEEDTNLDFRLTVTDRWGRTSSSSVRIEVQPNSVPTLTASTTEIRVSPTETFTLNVSATDTDGDHVTLALINPPPNATFAPVEEEGTASVTLGWRGEDTYGSRLSLIFEARDDRVPDTFNQIRVVVQVLDDDQDGSARIGDVTGDGILDIVVAATNAGRNGVPDRGLLIVWEGQTEVAGAPDHILSVDTAQPNDQLASDSRLYLEDVTGDGVLDIIAAAPDADVGGVTDAGALYVWEGGEDWGDAPSWTLALASSTSGDALGRGTTEGQHILFGDVDGDGVDDIVVGAPQFDGGATDSGGVFVWYGGATLSGAPDVSLAPASVTASDLLPQLTDGQALFLVDLTGDGILDVVAAGENVDIGGEADVGAIFVWEGGSLTSTPDTTMSVPVANGGDRLGANNGAGIHFIDVTDDGTVDLLAISSDADPGGVTNVGAVGLWIGGDTLSSTPDAWMTAGAGGESNDCLGFDWDGLGAPLAVGDVTGDQVTDIVIGAPVARANDEGRVYVWAGPDFTDGHDAEVEVTGTADDQLGGRVWLGDLDNEGTLDIVALAVEGDANATDDGFLVVAFGSSGLEAGGATVAPDRQLSVSSGSNGDLLGVSYTRLADFNGDGVVDVIAQSNTTDLIGRTDTGAICVFLGSGALTQPDFTMAPETPRANDQFGDVDGPPWWLADVDGDGAADRIAASNLANSSGVADVGSIYVWLAGTSLGDAPDHTLVPPVLVAGMNLGRADRVAFQVTDVTGDGIADIVGSAEDATAGGKGEAGACFVWVGGESLGDAPLVLEREDPMSGDELCEGVGGHGTWTADVTGDGVVDLVLLAPTADTAGVVDAGCLVVWPGGSEDATTTTLWVPSAHTGDQLGSTTPD